MERWSDGAGASSKAPPSVVGLRISERRRSQAHGDPMAHGNLQHNPYLVISRHISSSFVWEPCGATILSHTHKILSSFVEKEWCSVDVVTQIEQRFFLGFVSLECDNSVFFWRSDLRPKGATSFDISECNFLQNQLTNSVLRLKSSRVACRDPRGVAACLPVLKSGVMAPGWHLDGNVGNFLAYLVVLVEFFCVSWEKMRLTNT